MRLRRRISARSMPSIARRLVGEPLQHVAGLRAGRRRDRRRSARVLVNTPVDSHGDRRRAVDAGEQRAVDRARNAGAEGRDIGADIGDGVDAQREEMPLARRARARRGCGDRAPWLSETKHSLRRRHPFHRPPQPPRRPGDDAFPRDSACPCSRSRRRHRARSRGCALCGRPSCSVTVRRM